MLDDLSAQFATLDVGSVFRSHPVQGIAVLDSFS
jgi:hypothetical protein